MAKFSLYVHKGGLKPDSFHNFKWVKITHICLIWDQEILDFILSKCDLTSW